MAGLILWLLGVPGLRLLKGTNLIWIDLSHRQASPGRKRLFLSSPQALFPVKEQQIVARIS
jgi:hypothetical protein